MSFSIARGADCKFPPSLRNILNEAEADVAARRPPPGEGDLTPWAQRGVLLLNACLTVRRGEANSHKASGWALRGNQPLVSPDSKFSLRRSGAPASRRKEKHLEVWVTAQAGPSSQTRSSPP